MRCVLSLSASFLVFAAFCYGGGECNILSALLALTAKKFTYMIGIFAISCHFRHYAILCHFITFHITFAAWHGEFFMPAKKQPCSQQASHLCHFPDIAPRSHLLAVLTSDGMFFFRPVLSYLPSRSVRRTQTPLCQLPLVFSACCASF